MTVFHVVSYSTGKDSDETLRQCLARFPKERVRAVICDTGNESDLAWEHKAYIEQRFGIVVEVLRADFSAELAAKRVFIARDVRTRREYKKAPRLDEAGNIVHRKTNSGELDLRMVWKGDKLDLQPIPRMRKVSGRRVRWTNTGKRRALAAMHPSGNPFLDLCMWKGRFPARKSQFCTQELKTALLVQYQQSLVEQGHRVVSWQGVRRDESANRRNAKRFERLNPRIYAYRPLVEWTAMQVFASLAAHDIQPNELYRQEMSRVGCFPCINVNKPELRAIATRWPAQIDRIGEWESKVGACSKRGFSTFMTDADDASDRREIFDRLNIRARVEWSKTTRGGKQFDLLSNDDPPACASAYGLCE